MVCCGEPDLFLNVFRFWEKRRRESGAQEKSCVHVGAELAQRKDSSVAAAQEDFTKNLKPFYASSQLWAGRRDPLMFGNARMRQCKSGEL